ncbi:LOG family protein [Lysinibacillus sp. NPDC086135]|uniref:LOG family protein n=1 Tax=Lysinibacillus sp. NPDC086135 TaxID=3364130 RepID=UPI0037FE1BEF
MGLLQKPCGLLNINHYYDLLIGLFDHMQNAQFLQAQYRNALLVDEDVVGLLDKCAAYVPPTVKTYQTIK